MLDVPGRIRPYLRRAYSVADARAVEGEVEFLVKTIGPGTAALEALPPGATLGLLGPLGNGFSVADLPRGARVGVVAGGIGAAPFPLLFRSLREAGVTGDFFLGGRTARDLAFRRRFEGAGTVSGKTLLTTEDGSEGERGLIVDAFAARALDANYARVYACGPMGMFRALAPIVAELEISAEFSTEAEMGCGFGACLGCVLPSPGGGFLVSCQEGPILPPERIAWERI